MRWQQGRGAIDGMIARGEVERVPASRAHADLLIQQAHRHVVSARTIASIDAAGAYQLLYDAAARPWRRFWKIKGYEPGWPHRRA